MKALFNFIQFLFIQKNVNKSGEDLGKSNFNQPSPNQKGNEPNTKPASFEKLETSPVAEKNDESTNLSNVTHLTMSEASLEMLEEKVEINDSLMLTLSYSNTYCSLY